jgi:hypothetical protein
VKWKNGRHYPTPIGNSTCSHYRNGAKVVIGSAVDVINIGDVQGISHFKDARQVARAARWKNVERRVRRETRPMTGGR